MTIDTPVIKQVGKWLAEIGARNKAYDSDVDGILDVDAVPDLTRSKITDFFDSPFWDNIPDKPSTFPPEDHTHGIGDLIDFVNVSKVIIDTSANRPSAGIAGRLFFETDTHIVWYDDGSSWVKLGVADWDNIDGKPSSFPPDAHASTHASGGSDELSLDASQITGGTIARPFSISVADCYIDVHGLVIGNTSGRTSGERLELWGGTSSAILSVQDGNGRIQMKWNATRGTNETFLVGGENAGMWEFDPASASTDLFRIKYADGSNASAGDSISWQDILQVGTSGMKLFKGGFYPGGDNTLDIGSSSLRWKDGYFAGTVYTGDVEFKNKWRITEYDENGNVMEDGLRILNNKGEEIFKITEDGLWFKGQKVI